MPKKSGLGRGLSSLISEAQEEVGIQEQNNEISLDEIIPNPNQPRKNFDQTLLEELAESIKEVGVLQPLLLKKDKDKYIIIAGERRYQASKLAGLTKVPAIIKDTDEIETLKLALIENLQRSDLNPIEEARGFRDLINAGGLKQSELAEAVSKSRSSIANALRLLDLPEEIQTLLYDEKITAGHARAILAVPEEDKRIKLAQKVVEDSLSVRETERLAPLYSGNISNNRTRTETPKSFKIAARTLKNILGTNVRVRNVRGKNKIEIEFNDERDLARLIDMLEDGENHEIF
ncbi:MAG: ParB/RepB/Spo0J family partition protein [Coriobacteriia bacterium]|nr:ParB/RepB/Spo0J family partition protein [Coriobacteriia bacterium]